MLKKTVGLITFACALTWIAASLRAATVDSQISDRVAKAASIVRAMNMADDRRIPDELLQRAEAVAVVPGVIKGPLGLDGRGLVSERLVDGRWTAPVFIQIARGGWEPQAEGAATDVVLIFTNVDALRTLEEGTGLTLGVDASMVAGPVGQSIEAVTDAKLETAIYAYSHSMGLFTGITLGGAVLGGDDNATHGVYGPDITARKVFLGETILANATVKPFIDAVQRVTIGRKVTQR